jgi:cardiolipin synthase
VAAVHAAARSRPSCGDRRIEARRARRLRKLIWLVALVLVVSVLAYRSCRPYHAPVGSAAVSESLIIEPDDGRQPVLDYINGAQQTLDVAIYELTDKRIATALEDAAGRGVQVRVMAEPRPDNKPVNASTMAELARKGVQTRDSSPSFKLTHEKAMVADGTSTLIMSMNLVSQTFNDTRDVAVLDTTPADVTEVESVFESDWDRVPDSASDSALVWSPDNSRSRLLSLMTSATATLDIYAEELTDQDVIAALRSAASSGVQVRLLMTDTGSHDPARPGRALLAAAGAQVRVQSKPFVHAKVIIADGTNAFAGSENFTGQSLNDNRELGILSHDPATIARLQATFEQDWGRATRP